MLIEIVVPDWVRWMAVDADGCCFGYPKKPGHTNEDLNWWYLAGGTSILLYRAAQPKNWKDELYTWR